MHSKLCLSALFLALFCAAAARAEDALDLLRDNDRPDEVIARPGKAPGFTVTFDAAPFGEAVREISRRGGANVIFSPGVPVDSPVTLSFAGVPWRDALESILRAHGCAVLHDAGDSILRIVTAGEADREFETRSRPLRYIQPEGARFRAEIVGGSLPGFVARRDAADPDAGQSLIAVLENVKSGGGSVSYESRTNTLVLRDTAGKIQEMLGIVDEIDVAPRQVLLETRMITMDREPESAAGLLPDGGGADGRFRPGALSPGELDSFLRTAACDGSARLIQSPRILALDNEEASVFVGSVRPSFSGEGEAPVGVQLLVVPRVCGGTDQVILEVVPIRTDAPDLSGMRVEAARTKMMIRSGETGVITGLFHDKVSKVPVAGGLFRREEELVTKRNTLILVTATVVPPEGGEEAFDSDVEAVRASLAAAL